METHWWDEALASTREGVARGIEIWRKMRGIRDYGTNVCRVHGGAAAQVKLKAALGLAMAAVAMARNLLGLAEHAGRKPSNLPRRTPLLIAGPGSEIDCRN